MIFDEESKKPTEIVPVDEVQSMFLYEEACRAVAACLTVREAREWVNKADAIRVYAKRAKNLTLEIDSAEITIRSERQVGIILNLLALEGKYGVGKAAPGHKALKREITVKSLGLSKHQATAYAHLAKINDDEFENRLLLWRRHVISTRRVMLPLQAAKYPSAYVRDGEAKEFRKKNPARRPPSKFDPFVACRMIDGGLYADLYASSVANRLIRATKIQALVLENIAQVWRAMPGAADQQVREFVTVKMLEKFIADAEKQVPE